MKYVIFQVGDFVHPVVFADHTTHKQVKVEGGVPISGGFVRWSSKLHFPECYGKAVSLGLESRPEIDSYILMKWEGSYNMMSFYNEILEAQKNINAITED